MLGCRRARLREWKLLVLGFLLCLCLCVWHSLCGCQRCTCLDLGTLIRDLAKVCLLCVKSVGNPGLVLIAGWSGSRFLCPVGKKHSTEDLTPVLVGQEEAQHSVSPARESKVDPINDVHDRLRYGCSETCGTTAPDGRPS